MSQQAAEIEESFNDEASSAAPAAVHTDTSDAVKKALEASRVFGKTSVEARMAWELVEELDSAKR